MEEDSHKLQQDDRGQNVHAEDHDHELSRFGDHGDFDERLSDISDGGLSIGADTDGSADNAAVPAEVSKSNNSER